MDHAAAAVRYTAASLIATLTGSVVYCGNGKKLADLCSIGIFGKLELGNTPGLVGKVEELTGQTVKVLSYDTHWGHKWNSGGSPTMPIKTALDMLGEFSSSYTGKMAIVARNAVGPFGKPVIGVGLYCPPTNECMGSILMTPQKS